MEYEAEYRRYEREWELESDPAAVLVDELPPQETRGGGGTGADIIGSIIGFGLALFLLIWLLRAAVVCIVATIPVAFAVWLYTRLVDRNRMLAFGEAFVTAFIAIFVYLAFTVMIALVTDPLHEGVRPGGFATFVNALLELRRESWASLVQIEPGQAHPAVLSGLLGSGIKPQSVRLAAVAALHLPGLAMFAFALNRYIGPPYAGLVGALNACAVAFIVFPLCLGSLLLMMAVR